MSFDREEYILKYAVGKVTSPKKERSAEDEKYLKDNKGAFDRMKAARSREKGFVMGWNERKKYQSKGE